MNKKLLLAVTNLFLCAQTEMRAAQTSRVKRSAYPKTLALYQPPIIQGVQKPYTKSIEGLFSLYYSLSRRTEWDYTAALQDALESIQWKDSSLLGLFLLFGMTIENLESITNPTIKEEVIKLLIRHPNGWSIDQPLSPFLQNTLDSLFGNALYWGKYTLADELIAIGANPNIMIHEESDVEEQYPFIIDITSWWSEGRLKRIEYLASKANLNLTFSNKKITPLHWVAERADNKEFSEIVPLLLQQGANPSTKDIAGNTPLHLLCSHSKDHALLIKPLVALFLSYRK